MRANHLVGRPLERRVAREEEVEHGPERVKVRALDRDGKAFELEAEGLLAVCIQHEIDHLDGKVFVEYLSNLKLNRIRTKLAKRARITA